MTNSKRIQKEPKNSLNNRYQSFMIKEYLL